MRHEFKLQDPGEGVHEVEINEVLVSKGDQVSEGDGVLVVESDKAAIELPSPYSGHIVEIRVSEGEIAAVGDVLMVIEDKAEGAESEEEEYEEEEADPETEEAAEKEQPEEESEGPRRPAAEAELDEEAEEEPAEEEEGERKREPRPEREQAQKRAEKEAAETENTETEAAKEEGPIKAAPAARKLAKEEGVDLGEVEATGSKGHVTLDDVRAAVGEEAGHHTERKEEKEERDEFGPVERVKLRSIRAATARAMARSWAEIPHVTHQDAADITELERWRREQANAEGDETLTLTPFIVKAVAAVLRRHPRFNARLDQDSGEIVLRRYYNLNVAVATDRGLITPVIREVDRKPVWDLAHELAELTARMHAGGASKQDLAGGTFTVTNVGALGGTSFAPIINPPQTAILGCAKARLMPVVVDGDLKHLDSARIEARLMLPVIVAFDHRVLDGADAARFVNDLVELLQDVKAFALEV